MPRTRSVIAGYVILGLLGLSDALGFLLSSGDSGPPVAINALGTILGLITLGALVMIFQARRRPPDGPGRSVMLTLIITRVLSALLGVPAFFADIAGGIKVVVAVGIVLAIVGLLLIRPDVPQPAAGGTSTMPAT